MESFALWTGEVPGKTHREVPMIHYYPASEKKGRGTVVIFPGGGYSMRAPHEGEGYATFLNEFGLDAFVGCSSLARIAIPKKVMELEDTELFAGCDSLTEISFGGDEALFENLTRGRAITVQRSDLSLFTPKITFMDLKDEI